VAKAGSITRIAGQRVPRLVEYRVPDRRHRRVDRMIGGSSLSIFHDA
jgi:hypothetical protein